MAGSAIWTAGLITGDTMAGSLANEASEEESDR